MIVGTAGVGRYLLLYIEHFEDKEDCLQEKAALEQILKYFVKLSADTNVNAKKIIGFVILPMKISGRKSGERNIYMAPWILA